MSAPARRRRPELSEDFIAQLKYLMKGERGIQGWDGRSPMHVSEEKPKGDVQKGDLWYQPSTEKLRLFTGSAWKEIAKQGIMGFEGGKGKDGRDGKDGKDGKDADYEDVKLVAEVRTREGIETHEKKFDHELIDPFLLGTKKISEAGMKDGLFIMFDQKNNRLVYAPPPMNKVTKVSGGGGTTLPPRTGNGGKFLTTDGTTLYWANTSGSFVDKEVPTGDINDVNTVFTLANTPAAGSDHWYLNGVLQNEGASNDYVLSGDTATFAVAPPEGSILLVSYRT